MLNRTAFAIVAGLILLISGDAEARQNPALAITSPANGAVVNPGQTLVVTVTSPAGVAFSTVNVIGEGFIGIGDFVTSLPAQFSFSIPANAACRKYALTAIGRTTADAIVTVDMEIDVERPDMPTSISVRLPQLAFDAQGQRSSAAVLGHFADGAVLDVTESTRVTYASSDTNVAIVDAVGMITATGPGTAEITVSYGTSPDTRTATIRVIVPPPPFTVAPAALDFGTHDIGTVSTLQMTLTNTTGEPLTIAEITATTDFSSTDNCVSLSPLAAEATCTITVSFTPTATGLKQGWIHVANADDVVGFSVKGAGSAPPAATISSFSPQSGPIGTGVTITGTGFSATPAQNSVTFNGTAATVTSSTTTSIDVTVPAGATTGPIAVTSPNGSATSASNFTVTVPDPPTIAGFSPTIGVAGTSVTITGTNFAAVPASNQVRFNTTTAAAATSATATSLTVAVPASTGSGRISVTTSAGTAVSSADFIIPPSPYVVVDVDSASRLSFGTATTVTVATATKIALRLFDGTQGQRVSLIGANGIFGQILGCDINVSIRKPDGGVLGQSCMEGSGYIDAVTLPATGTYTIVVDPEGNATGGVTLTLYDIPADVTGPITAGGASVTVTLGTPGQNAVLTFSGTAGQRVSVMGPNGTIYGQVLGCDVNVAIRKPDGSVLGSAVCMEGGGFLEVQTLPVSGTYSLVVDPVNHATGNLTLNLYEVSDYSGTIAAGGAAVTVNLPTPGQNGVLTFSGTAGQRVSLTGTNGTIAAQVLGCDVNVAIRKPDGSGLGAATCMEGSGYIEVQTLPVTGTYSIAVDPVAHATGNLTLNLYDVSDIAGTIVAGGSAVTVTISSPGQNAVLTFTGTAGQRVSLLGSGGSLQWQVWGCDVDVSIRKPDGSLLAGPTCMEGGGYIDVQTLPVTGTYSVAIDPISYAVGNATFALHTVSDYEGTIVAGGPAVTVSLPTPGQNGTLTFSGTTGQRVSVVGTNGTIQWQVWGCDVNVTIRKPDGSVLAGPACMETSGSIGEQTLPVTGTYTIVIDPASFATGNLTLTLNEITPPADDETPSME